MYLKPGAIMYTFGDIYFPNFEDRGTTILQLKLGLLSKMKE